MKLFRRDESGQVLAIFALALVALLGFAALAIDVSLMLHKRAELQKAADAAALAGIMDVWEKTSTHAVGEARAIDYAKTNGAEKAEADVLLHYEPYTAKEGLIGNPIFLQVKVESTVNHFFGPVIGMKSSLIQADAIAVKIADWRGESLPFVNLGTKPGSGVGMTIWNKEGPGEKESIWKSERTYHAEPIPHFKVTYLDGIEMQNGKDHSIADQLQEMWDYHKGSSQTVYILSLRPEAFDKGYFYTSDEVKVNLPECKELKNKATIPIEELVLLECKWTAFNKESGNNTTLKLTVTKIHDIKAVPDSYDGVGKVNSYLVK